MRKKSTSSARKSVSREKREAGSREQWEIVQYYAEHGAPRVRIVASRLLEERHQ